MCLATEDGGDYRSFTDCLTFTDHGFLGFFLEGTPNSKLLETPAQLFALDVLLP